MSPTIHKNTLLESFAKDQVNVSLGVKILKGVEIVHIAKSAGYDSLFVDLEHSTLTIKDAGQICIAALSAGVSPFIRVPHECGDGMIQKALDAGAMGVVVPHIDTVEQAQKAISITKFPPLGGRSITGALPQFDMAPIPPTITGPLLDQSGSVVALIIESGLGADNADAIANLPGADILVIGCYDLASNIGTLGEWDHPKFLCCLEKVAKACKKHDKHWGFGGLEHRPDLMDICVNEWGARWILGQQDFGLLLKAGRENSQMLKMIQKTK
ncbi:hypothetical protein PV10_05101 [Exophiala mesophila]|uniref:HpcH/HpaI aldolase/citrate lyase domain-containing protein n=1 Tax=Exophiala mesophila TaxID=212818 RepID=A0A0D1ZGX6_EXOME|nr:uncharacterized protein PV10_05101 [Exophiala mesophila]KIV93927.1 hypothetical protein PV10_05101 [Exophiala mesophila]